MLGNKFPFARDLADEDDLVKYVAQIQAMIGPPPDGFLEVAPSQSFWASNGLWTHPTVALPHTSLMNKLERVEEAQRSETADFLLCMLKWLPTKRSTAAELLQHPWLKF